MTNFALDYVVSCSASSDQVNDFFYGTVIYNCPVPDRSGGVFSFTYNQPTGELAVNQTWVCRDDPRWP